MPTTLKSDDAYEGDDEDFNLNNNSKQPPSKKREFGQKHDKYEERARLKRERDKAAGERVASGVRDRIQLPANFNRVEGYFLWNTFGIGRYRVNVLVDNHSDDSVIGATKIEQSYFVVADGDDILSMEGQNENKKDTQIEAANSIGEGNPKGHYRVAEVARRNGVED